MRFKSCPISQERIDVTALRLSGLFLAGFGVLYLLTHDILWFLPIVLELWLRLLRYPAPLLIVAKSLAKRLHIPSHNEDGAPKRFALKLGVAIATLTLLTSPWPAISLGLAALLLLCILLESLFGFCVGCVLYHFVVRR